MKVQMATVGVVKTSLANDLTKLVDNPGYLSAWSPQLTPSIGLDAERTIKIGPELKLAVSGKPFGAALAVKENDVIWKQARVMAQDLIAPLIEQAYPNSKPVVRGVQFVFAAKDLWDAMSDDEKDLTGKTITALRVAQKGLDVFFSVGTPSQIAVDLNHYNGMLITTSQGLYAIQLKYKGAGK